MKKNNALGIIIIVVIIFIVGAALASNRDDAPKRQGAVACAQDVKQCADGSYVSRVAPTCEFAACASAPAKSTSTGSKEPLKTIIIKYTDQGFSPTNVTIKKGQTVKFVNESSRNMWPASNPHPTHSLYPEFDSKDRVVAGQSFSFTFNKVGVWGYHNHSNANFTGTITVK